MDEYGIARANLAFAEDLYGQLSQEDGNLFFSPFNISAALSILYSGANGRTALEIEKVLHFSSTPEVAAEAFRKLAIRLKASQGPGTLETANSVWSERSFPLMANFVESSLRDYGAPIRPVDFLGGAEEARGEINAWVEEATHDRIKDLLSPGDVTRDTRIVLCSAIYFKNAWNEPFKSEYTHPGRFYLAAGKTADVRMMHQRAKLKMAQADGVGLLDLPYKGLGLSMVILLPEARDGLPRLEGRLGAGGPSLTHWLDRLAAAVPGDIDVSLPAFKVERKFHVAKVLKSLGISSAFSPTEADFSAMSESGKLFVSDVIHQAYGAVDELGTEAAAATAVIAQAAFARPAPEQVPSFNVDHPFIFLIREVSTGEILFWGRTVDPR
jgi:serpin B